MLLLEFYCFIRTNRLNAIIKRYIVEANTGHPKYKLHKFKNILNNEILCLLLTIIKTCNTCEFLLITFRFTGNPMILKY